MDPWHHKGATVMLVRRHRWRRQRNNAGHTIGRPNVVGQPPVRDDNPWWLIVQRTVNVCARRRKARIITRDEACTGE